MSTLNTKQRDALKDADFGDPAGRKFPILDQDDVDSAAHLIGKAANPEAVKKRIIAIAKRKGLKLPDAWQGDGQQAGEPDASDVHVDGMVQTPRRSGRYLGRIRDKVKAHFKAAATMTAEQWDALWQAARGHAGGKARADARQAYDSWGYPDLPGGDNATSDLDGDMDEGYGAQLEKADPSVHYRPATEVGQTCGGCRFFDPDPDDDGDQDATGACALVEGAIDPQAVCDLFRPLLPSRDAGEPRDVADLCAMHEGQTDGWRLFVEVEPALFATVPDWVPVLPRPGTYQHPSYGAIAITPERNARFVQNARARVYGQDIPIDAEHEPKTGGCFGTLTDYRQNADGSVDARAQWNDRGRAMIAGDRFKYVSPAWYERWTDAATGQEHQDVLIGLALTTRPFFKESALRPLVASERGLEAPDPTTNLRAAAPVVIFHALAPVRSDPGTPPQGGKMSSTPVVALTEEQARAMTERIAALEAERDAEKAMREEASTQVRQAAERVAALERQARHQRFSEQAQDWVEPDARVAFLEQLADQFGEDSEMVQTYVTQQQAHAEAIRPLLMERGRDGAGSAGNPAEKLNAMAHARAKETGLSLTEAMGQIAAEQPDLYRKHTEAATVKV